MDFIHQKESNLDEDITLLLKYLKKGNVEKEKFIDGDEYLLSSLHLKLKNEDIAKWIDYK